MEWMGKSWILVAAYLLIQVIEVPAKCRNLEFDIRQVNAKISGSRLPERIVIFQRPIVIERYLSFQNALIVGTNVFGACKVRRARDISVCRDIAKNVIKFSLRSGSLSGMEIQPVYFVSGRAKNWSLGKMVSPSHLGIVSGGFPAISKDNGDRESFIWTRLRNIDLEYPHPRSLVEAGRFDGRIQSLRGGSFRRFAGNLDCPCLGVEFLNRLVQISIDVISGIRKLLGCMSTSISGTGLLFGGFGDGGGINSSGVHLVPLKPSPDHYDQSRNCSYPIGQRDLRVPPIRFGWHCKYVGWGLIISAAAILIVGWLCLQLLPYFCRKNLWRFVGSIRLGLLLIGIALLIGHFGTQFLSYGGSGENVPRKYPTAYLSRGVVFGWPGDPKAIFLEVIIIPLREMADVPERRFMPLAVSVPVFDNAPSVQIGLPIFDGADLFLGQRSSPTKGHGDVDGIVGSDHVLTTFSPSSHHVFTSRFSLLSSSNYQRFPPNKRNKAEKNLELTTTHHKPRRLVLSTARWSVHDY